MCSTNVLLPTATFGHVFAMVNRDTGESRLVKEDAFSNLEENLSSVRVITLAIAVRTHKELRWNSDSRCRVPHMPG